MLLPVHVFDKKYNSDRRTRLETHFFCRWKSVGNLLEASHSSRFMTLSIFSFPFPASRWGCRVMRDLPTPPQRLRVYFCGAGRNAGGYRGMVHDARVRLVGGSDRQELGRNGKK